MYSERRSLWAPWSVLMCRSTSCGTSAIDFVQKSLLFSKLFRSICWADDREAVRQRPIRARRNNRRMTNPFAHAAEDARGRKGAGAPSTTSER